MKKEFLVGLKLEEDVIKQIQAENGKDIEREKAKFADYDDLKAQLEKAQKTIEGFGDVDSIKADVEKYKEAAKKAQQEADAKVAKLELQAKVKEFTSPKKFINDLTRSAINSLLEERLNDPASKGKSMDDLFTEITKEKENILAEEDKPTPPKTTPMGGKDEKDDTAEDARIDEIMGLTKE